MHFATFSLQICLAVVNLLISKQVSFCLNGNVLLEVGMAVCRIFGSDSYENPQKGGLIYALGILWFFADFRIANSVSGFQNLEKFVWIADTRIQFAIPSWKLNYLSTHIVGMSVSTLSWLFIEKREGCCFFLWKLFWPMIHLL